MGIRMSDAAALFMSVARNRNDGCHTVVKSLMKSDGLPQAVADKWINHAALRLGWENDLPSACWLLRQVGVKDPRGTSSGSSCEASTRQAQGFVVNRESRAGAAPAR
jgi:hypothetical protein